MATKGFSYGFEWLYRKYLQCHIFTKAVLKGKLLTPRMLATSLLDAACIFRVAKIITQHNQMSTMHTTQLAPICWENVK